MYVVYIFGYEFLVVGIGSDIFFLVNVFVKYCLSF